MRLKTTEVLIALKYYLHSTRLQGSMNLLSGAIFLFNLIYVLPLDYSFLSKARHDEIIEESITLHSDELILR